MVILRIAHKVPDFDGWKRAFDSDPIGRKRSGVRRYRIFRAKEEPNWVTLDLEFDDRPAAEAALTALRKLWGQITGSVILGGPEARILEVVESKEY